MSAEFTPPHIVRRVTQEQDAQRDERAASDEREARLLEPLPPDTARRRDAIDLVFARARVAGVLLEIAEHRARLVTLDREREVAEDALADTLRRMT